MIRCKNWAGQALVGAYCKGRKARAEGKSLDDNPYHSEFGPKSFSRAWADGWADQDAKILKAESKCRTCWYGHMSYPKQEIYCLNVQVPATATFRTIDSIPHSETCYVSDTEGRAL